MKVVLASLALLGLGAGPAALRQDTEGAVTPAEHRRGPEQTFLTYPEWFLVHSPTELAAYLQDRPPSTFPYGGHICQFWQSYRTVYRATREDYPFNLAYHVMVTVIGVSTTVEYGAKGAYETLVGRLTEVTRTHGMTDEDVVAARVARDYVDFINLRPWYEYDFVGALGALWRETDFWGPDLLRKWERKYILTTEYGVKAVYGWIIGRLTRMGYTAPIPVTAVLLDHLPEAARTELPDLTVLQELPDGRVLITVPRYDAFKTYAAWLAGHGARFLEIAGNRTPILVSYLVPAGSRPGASRYDIVLTQPILTRPDEERLVISVPVTALHLALREFDQPRFRLEHIYDY